MLQSQIPAAQPEVQALGSSLYDFLSAIKAGKTPVEAAESAGGDLLSAVNGASNIGTDIKLAHNQVYLAWAIIQVYEPEPAVTAAS